MLVWGGTGTLVCSENFTKKTLLTISLHSM